MSEPLPPEIQEELETSTELFGEAYALAAEAKAEQETQKKAYFDAFDKALATRRLPRKTIEVSGDTYTVSEFVERYYPDWEIVKILNDDFPYKVQIQRKPSMMRYAFTHPGTKMTYQRTVQEGAPSLDEERLRKEDPDLWATVSDWPEPPSWLRPFVGSLFGVQGDNVAFGESWIIFCEREGEQFGLLRQLKPPVAWSSTQAARLQKYMIPGAITVKIVKPRAATEEELAAL